MQIWTGDDEDDGVDSQEERLLRAWLNTLLAEGRASGSSGGAHCTPAPAVKLMSLFEPAMRTVRGLWGGDILMLLGTEAVGTCLQIDSGDLTGTHYTPKHTQAP